MRCVVVRVFGWFGKEWNKKKAGRIKLIKKWLENQPNKFDKFVVHPFDLVNAYNHLERGWDDFRFFGCPYVSLTPQLFSRKPGTTQGFYSMFLKAYY
jgi:hypothetical protein